ncbi:MAG: hypothetical protein IJO14_01925 [Clostridia bacterium]|nr:hypothetical protein [Clostridia bacterium]
MKKLMFSWKTYGTLLLFLIVAIIFLTCSVVNIFALVNWDSNHIENYFGTISFYREPIEKGVRYILETEKGEKVAIAVNGDIRVQEFETALAEGKVFHIKYLKNKDLFTVGKHIGVFLADENNKIVLLTEENGKEDVKARTIGYGIGGLGFLFIYIFLGFPILLLQLSKKSKCRRFFQRVLVRINQGTVRQHR